MVKMNVHANSLKVTNLSLHWTRVMGVRNQVPWIVKVWHVRNGNVEQQLTNHPACAKTLTNR